MKIRRRDFLKAASGLAVGSVAGSVSSFALDRSSEQSGTLRVAVFFESDFPFEDGVSIDRAFLERSFAGFDVTFLGLTDLKDKLNAASFQLLVLPYGSAFPKDGWIALSRYLKEGGNWLNLGGIPFSKPVVKLNDSWRKEVRQTEYHKLLGITQAFPVSGADIVVYQCAGPLEGTNTLLNQLTPKEIYEFYVRFTVTKDFPE